MRVRWSLGLLWAFAGAVSAQSVTIDAGSVWSSDDATIDLDCASLTNMGTWQTDDAQVHALGRMENNGTFSAADAWVQAGSDWINAGSFLAGTSRVVFDDSCDAVEARLEGASTFWQLELTTAAGKIYRLQDSQTQSVSQALRVTGVSGQHLMLRSTVPGVRANLAVNPGASQVIDWVAVADLAAPNGSAWLADGPPEAFNAIDAGNNYRWFAQLAQIVRVPATSSGFLFLLSLCLGAWAWRRLSSAPGIRF